MSILLKLSITVLFATFCFVSTNLEVGFVVLGELSEVPGEKLLDDGDLVVLEEGDVF